MYDQVEKPKENKNRSFSNSVGQKKSVPTKSFGFVDNLPEIVAQRKLQEMAKNSPQMKQVAQLQAMVDNSSVRQQQPIQKKENSTGLPDNLKTGIENFSGYSMDDENVHYNSYKPAQLRANAYAQGTDIYLGSGTEKHLPHEAWHVVQQKQGRVKSDTQMKEKLNVHVDVGLEKEAHVMKSKAINNKTSPLAAPLRSQLIANSTQTVQKVPRKVQIVWEVTHLVREMDGSLFGKGSYDEGEIGPEGELTAGQIIIVDDDDIFVSRRGPNQEDSIIRNRDRDSEPTIEWYRVLFLNGKSVYSRKLYARNGTFISTSDENKMLDFKESNLSSEVRQIMKNYQKVVQGFGDGSGIKTVEDFEKLFRSSGIEGSLHAGEGENKAMMIDPRGRSALIEIIRAALKLALEPIENPSQASLRDKLISTGFLATGCVAARISALSEVMGKTIRIMEAIKHQEEFIPFASSGKAKGNIENCIRDLFSHYVGNQYRAKQTEKYHTVLKQCAGAKSAIAVLLYLAAKEFPPIIMPLYNNLSKLAMSLESVSNPKKVEHCIALLSAEFDIYSDILIELIPGLGNVIGSAEYSGEVEGMADHILCGTLPSK